ncbi:hypothetical protein [Streptomyces turgidiscabies]|uniref:Secreted protein n=1 Tax=Streptomyces turgidiscabies TaxID=85558 RepID=A0ABU0S0P5_9ACTN|nr:hypothetical protein [Streptomyces turgidiscabies]MDQ0937812.1 hypothetical protein [Streptomyces turgidiscabies]
MAVRTVRWGALLGLGAVWWWAVLRLALAPGAGVLEGAVAAGGWGLSLLPVHCVPKARAVRGAGVTRAVRGPGGGDVGLGATRASPRRRSGGGSGPW